MSAVIDLYSKFLIAFVGIVTPALALYLNSYFINRTRFERIIKKQEKIINTILSIQNDIKSTGRDSVDIELATESNNKLNADKAKIEKWKKIVSDLDPKSFFKSNVLLLTISMTFLFVLLIIRAYFQDKNNCYYTLQFISFSVSIIACAIHISKLYNIGIYLINARSDVEDINTFMKDEEITKETEPGQTDINQN